MCGRAEEEEEMKEDEEGQKMSGNGVLLIATALNRELKSWRNSPLSSGKARGWRA